MERFWLNSYADYVPHDLPPLEHDSLIDLIQSSFAAYADEPAAHCMGTTLSYRQVDQKSRQFAAYLRNDLSLQPGDRVAIMLPNILQYSIALFGILRAGLVVVNANPLYTPRELSHQLSDSGAEVLLVLENFAHVAEKALPETAVKQVITTGVGDLLSFPKSAIVNGMLKYVKKQVPAYQLPASATLKQVLANSNITGYIDAERDINDIAFLQYTGGTTGVSKGVMLTHSNILSAILQGSLWTENSRETYKVVVAALPYYHIFALTANALSGMRHGALNVMIPNPRDFPAFVKELSKWEFSYFPAVNTLFRGLLNTPGFADLDFSHLRFSIGGGMAVTKDVAEQWRDVTGCEVLEAYGLTETSPGVTANVVGAAWRGSIGLPVSSTYVKIVDDNDQELPIGGEGELCIKGPQVMKGYWQRPEATAESFTTDGYFKSGDFATIDEEGYITILDRKKDMINVSGFNVYPNEIEEVLSDHPDILETAAIGIPDEKSGEAVKLVVVKKNAALSEQDVQDFCRENLTAYKCPRVIEFCEELPKTNVGKILRRELRDAD